MSARILVVDDILANVKILEAKLSAAYFTVFTANNGKQALEVAARERPDLILLDVMMPEMDGFTCCRLLKADPDLSHIPVVMVTALDQQSDRVRGLEVGADDFLTKPPNDLALFARVRSLVRIKMMIDELRLRDETYRDIGGDEALLPMGQRPEPTGRVVIVESKESRAIAMREALLAKLPIDIVIAQDRPAAYAANAAAPADVFVVAQQLDGYDGLRLCSELRSLPETRQSAVMALCEHGDYKAIAAALDNGANDYLMRPVDNNELVARIRSQLLRKHYADKLRENVQQSVRMAVTDPMTGLYNRRYVDSHLSNQLRRRTSQKVDVAVMLMDIDRFKSINDGYGHAVGDEVIIEFANRIRRHVRGVDLCARYGGEEFLVVMPETSAEEGMVVAERVRAAVAATPFAVSAPCGSLPVTVSIGVALARDHENGHALIERADQALYRSKHEGRNRVTSAEG